MLFHIQRGPFPAPFGNAFGFPKASVVGSVRQEQVGQNADDDRDEQAGDCEGYLAQQERDAAQGADAKAEHQDHGNDDQVAAVGEVKLALGQRPDTDGGDHTEQHDLDATLHRAGDCLQDGAEFPHKAQDDGKHRGTPQKLGIVVFRGGQNAGVFGIGGVGGAAK